MDTFQPDLKPAYRPPKHPAPIDLDLSGGERSTNCAELGELLEGLGADTLRRYPSSAALERQYAERMGLEPDGVYVTAGADEAIDRLCRAFVSPGDNVVCPSPCFEMIPRYTALAGGELRSVDWPGGAYPTDAVLARVDARTRLAIVVTPNNPTGGVATYTDVERVSTALPHALVLVDLAYSEFADEDLTKRVLGLPNVVVTRTLSKAWGLAGLRVGFAIGPRDIVERLRAAGGPYSVSGPSVAIAAQALRCGTAAKGHYVGEVRRERERLEAIAPALGWSTQPSQGNFVLWRGPQPRWLRDGLAGLGIAVRVFPDVPTLADAVRITCPGEAVRYSRLEAAINSVLRPEAVLLDMDGVLADVSRSYREAIVATAKSFGVEVGPADIEAEKARGNANDDWSLTQRLLAAGRVEVPLEQVTRIFESLYQGDGDTPGLRTHECLIPDRSVLERLRVRARLGIVTGRPRHDAFRFLRDQAIENLFDVVVCREDAPLKPDPGPIRLAMECLSERDRDRKGAWFVGDTTDDIHAARSAGVVPLGYIAPGSNPDRTGPALLRNGAARVLRNLSELEELLS